MNIIRYANSSTNRNANALIDLINAPETGSICLYASVRDPEHAAPSDGPETNFPLLAALVDYAIPGFEDATFIVFDGLFLTAAREQRAAEISPVLDAAIASGHGLFGTEPAPFTSSVSAEHAKELLAALPTAVLSEETRADFWRQLSLVPEN